MDNIQKPARYIGGEYGEIVKETAEVRFGFCFPDMYEIGMSNLALQIIYGLLNEIEWCACERIFAPAEDFELYLRQNKEFLCTLETKTPVKSLDILGFTLGYELCYTNILNILDLSGVPILRKNRGEESPIVIAGGCCTCNPLPLVDFVDIFVIGDGEEVLPELLTLYRNCKTKAEFKERAVEIDGIYNPDSQKIAKRRIITDLDNMYTPEKFLVPYSEIVHERASIEVLRGCIRGCRFCQAGFIYRPYREKSAEKIVKQSQNLCQNTGYEELSLISLSTSDHSEINKMMCELINYTQDKRINLALPSMRADSFSNELVEYLTRVKKNGLTFAPEAGTERLRNVINKNLTEKEILNACNIAFIGGYTTVKLYFMLGLPTETDEDILGIIDIATKIEKSFFSLGKKGLQINISVSTFVPKPYTPFQFCGQATREEILHKQEILRNAVKSKRIKISTHPPDSGILEAVFSRGDEKLCKVLYRAWELGCKFDAWNEYFNWKKWEQAFAECGINPEEYAAKNYNYSEILPWERCTDMGFSREFLANEHRKAMSAVSTSNCREKCNGCSLEFNCKIPQPNVENVNILQKKFEYPPNHIFPKIRVIFSKKGDAKYISHLDLNRLMQRIIKRSGIPVKYTEGYNPHYGISFPMALPFGVESDYEIMDFKIENNLDFAEISAKLTSAMPQGLSVKSVSNPKYDIREIFAAKYVITVATNNAYKFKEFLLQEKIVISKKAKEKNKKIIKEIDIKNVIKCDLITENCINLQLPAAVTGGVNPISVMGIFEKFAGEKVEYYVNKTALIMENGELFL